MKNVAQKTPPRPSLDDVESAYEASVNREASGPEPVAATLLRGLGTNIFEIATKSAGLAILSEVMTTMRVLLAFEYETEEQRLASEDAMHAAHARLEAAHTLLHRELMSRSQAAGRPLPFRPVDVAELSSILKEDAAEIREEATALFFAVERLQAHIPMPFEPEVKQLVEEAPKHLLNIVAASGYLAGRAEEASVAASSFAERGVDAAAEE